MCIMPPDFGYCVLDPALKCIPPLDFDFEQRIDSYISTYAYKCNCVSNIINDGIDYRSFDKCYVYIVNLVVYIYHFCFFINILIIFHACYQGKFTMYILCLFG